MGCRAILLDLPFFFPPIKIAVAPIITSMLKIADHTIVPAPRLSLFPAAPKIVKRANIEVNSSGALLPIAIKVAPVISEESFSFSDIFSSDATKKSSQMIARR